MRNLCDFAIWQLIQVLCDLIFAIVVAAFPFLAKVGIYLTLLGLLLAGLLLQRTLDTLVRFASCHRSDCSVLAAGARMNRCLRPSIRPTAASPGTAIDSMFVNCTH